MADAEPSFGDQLGQTALRDIRVRQLGREHFPGFEYGMGFIDETQVAAQFVLSQMGQKGLGLRRPGLVDAPER